MARFFTASARSRSRPFWLLAALCLIAAPALAARGSFPKAPQPAPGAVMSEQERSAKPVLIEADQMGYDQKQELVVARGHVEIVQGDEILQADQVSYSQATDLVRADGNVRLLQPDGNVIFADHVELKQALKTGIVDNFRARLADNSVFAAREARRVSETVVKMKNGVYSPCKLPSCEEARAEGKSPLWQMKARTITKDDAAQEVYYRDAWLEFYGVPLLYTPYLSHPTPDAEAKAGFLPPSYSRNSQLGFVLRTPYYVPFGTDKALTLTPVFTSQEGPLLLGQYRQRLENGYYQLDASGTNPNKIDAAGNQVPGNEFRGHIAGRGIYTLDPVWNTGFDFTRATDDTYLRRYNLNQDYTLKSHAYVEGINDRTHAVVQGYAFQNTLVNNDPGKSPIVLPYADYSTESAAGWAGSRWRVESGALALTRTDGTDTQRFNALAGWRLPYVSPQGHVFELDTQMRTEAYNVADLTLASGQSYSGQNVRVMPQASLTWRYPLQEPVGSARWILEPLAGVAVSPTIRQNKKIPNEDSQVLEFSDTNIFSFDRFPGLDQVESGPRAFYGVRNTLQLESGPSIYGLVGQNYQQNADNPFPFTNDFNNTYSDYIGAVGTTSDWFNAVYRFRLAQEDLTFKRHDVSFLFTPGGGSLGIEYINLRNDPYIAERNQILVNLTVEVVKNWNVSSYVQRDLTGKYGMLGAGGGLNFTNECFQWLTTLNRTYTQDRDIRPDTSITTQVFFKNIN